MKTSVKEDIASESGTKTSNFCRVKFDLKIFSCSEIRVLSSTVLKSPLLIKFINLNSSQKSASYSNLYLHIYVYMYILYIYIYIYYIYNDI